MLICIKPSMRFDISLQNFKKPLVDISSPQIEINKLKVRRVFSYNFGCRKNKALSDFPASSSSFKTVNTRKPV